MKPKLQTVTILIIAFLLISGVLFWKGQGGINFSSPINSERFNQFGGFVAGILSAFTLILLLYTLNEARIQTFDNSFYNHLHIHDSIITALRNNEKEVTKLNNEDLKRLFENNLCDTIQNDVLKNECKDYEKMTPVNDYFETLYQILHIRYKYKNELEQFFLDYNWRIGHYLRSFISIVELINESNFDNKKKKFHIRVLKARSSDDELRLVFYYIISMKDKIKRCTLLKLFAQFDFFVDVKNLIHEVSDKNFHNALLEKCKKK